MVSFAKQLTFSLSRPEAIFSILAKVDMAKFALAMGNFLQNIQLIFGIKNEYENQITIMIFKL